MATRKLEALPEALRHAILSGNPRQVEAAITNPEVEREVQTRVAARAAARLPHSPVPERVAALYADWIVPLSRKIQVHGLLAER